MEKISYDDKEGIVVRYLNKYEGIWHYHPEFEIVLTMEGNGTRIVGDSVELFEACDLVMIAGNIPHAWNYYAEDDIIPEKHGIVVHFSESSFGDRLLTRHEMNEVRELLRMAERGIGFSSEDACKTRMHLEAMTESRGIDKVINFFNVLRLMCRADCKKVLCSENYKISEDTGGNKRMSDVYTYIRENFFNPISLEKVSAIAGMTPFAFSRFFKNHCGSGFVEYLNRLRTSKACYLLRETEYMVHDIASKCGFESISNFNKQFRKSEGVSPRIYRAQFR
ncbi:MAG TPA: AraC family transcriptional regulator [Bacteroidales bacterium]|nr:AraC family transcriptional regulator [Bacteroidales bacterium]HPJ58624.1 AraC family transcriptional regulator [Bacteroidales bacterium]HPR11217.1 AraC family transcriptional regulator [Bacteroidales bacterium]HRW85499.1 AraC family transcriptional regulator [Bacteroidales bacterium]